MARSEDDEALRDAEVSRFAMDALAGTSKADADDGQAPAPEMDAEKAKQLRRAGQDFLDRAIQKTKMGQDPFLPQLKRERVPASLGVDDTSTSSHPRDTGASYLEPASPSPSASNNTDPTASSSGRPRLGSSFSMRRRGVAEDPDVAAFGQLFESSKVYAYLALYLLCQSASLVLVKGSMFSMKTPAILTFLHMLATSLAMWLAASYDVFELSISGPQLKGSSVRVCLYASQMICTFSALLRSSVNFVVAWQCIAPPLLDALLLRVVLGRPVALEVQPVIALGAGLAVMEMLADSQKSWLSFLMLSLWSLSKALEWVWNFLRDDATARGMITDYGIIGRIREVSDEEEALSAPRRALLVNALPAVPVLLIGFCCLEGNELVDHELSVPAVSVMLLSCAAYTVGTGAQLLLEGRLDAQSKVYLRSGALLGTVIFNYVEHVGTKYSVSIVTVLLAGAAATTSGYISWLGRERRKGAVAATADPTGTV